MFRGKKYKKIAESIDRAKAYGLKEAIEILKKSELKFDQTVEVHFNLGVDPKHSDQVVRGTVVLPHGTGRQVRVLVFCKDNNLEVAKNAGADYAGGADLVQKIQEGWLDFDAVVATPDMMPVISKVARVLGPRGMMPSPKAGTADEICELLEHAALGPGGESRTFDADVCSAHVVGDLHLLGGLIKYRVHLRAERIGDCYMDGLVHEESVIPLLGEVNHLVDDDQIAGLEILPERTDGTGRDDHLNSELFQSVDVRPVGHARRRVLVLVAVPRKERDLHTVDLSDQYLIRRLAIGCVGEDLLDQFESLGIVYSRSAYDSDSWHAP